MALSIIVPIYKVEKYLRRCIDSILNQTYRDIEVILVDDGSPDECGAICDSYAEADSQIKVIHQKNAGVSVARNAGLACAKGEYVGFVDPDDFVEPDMYYDMLNAMVNENADLVICGYNYVDEDGKTDKERLYQQDRNESLTQKQLMSRFSDMPPTVRLSVCNKLFSRNLLTGLEFEIGLHSSEDVLFLMEYSKNVKRAVFVHKPLYQNTVRAGSATHGGLNICSLADSFAVHDRMFTSIIAAYPDLKRHSLAFLLDVCLLKYNESLRKLDHMTQEERQTVMPRLNEMRHYIHKRAWQAVFNKDIYWKTRISYLVK